MMNDVIEKNKWIKHPYSMNMKGNNKFECYLSSGSNIIRNDTNPRLNYQMFLTKEDHEKIIDEMNYKGYQ